MRHHGGIAGALGHIDCCQCFGQRANLVDLDQDGIGGGGFDAARQPGDIGDEKVIPDQLHLAANFFGQQLPSRPVIFRHAVLNRGNREILGQFGEIGDLLFNRALFALALVMVDAILEELGGGAVEAQHHVLAGLEARRLDGLDAKFQRRLGGGQIGGKAAFIANIGVVARLFQRGFQHMKHFRPPAHRFFQRGCADGQDHEFLKINGIVGMDTAIDDVHHRHRQHSGLRAADIAVEIKLRAVGGGLGHGERHAQNGIGPKARLVGRAVERNHRLVDQHLILRLIADNGIGNLVIDSGDGFQHALAAKALLVAIAQFHRLMRAGGGPGRHSSAALRAIFQRHIHFDRRVAPAVHDFTGNDIDDFSHEGLWAGKGKTGSGYTGFAGKARLASGESCALLQSGSKQLRQYGQFYRSIRQLSVTRGECRGIAACDGEVQGIARSQSERVSIGKPGSLQKVIRHYREQLQGLRFHVSKCSQGTGSLVKADLPCTKFYRKSR